MIQVFMLQSCTKAKAKAKKKMAKTVD